MELIDYRYMGTNTGCIAVNGLCRQNNTHKIAKIAYLGALGSIEFSNTCILHRKGRRLPECIDCLTNALEGLYDKAHRH